MSYPIIRRVHTLRSWSLAVVLALAATACGSLSEPHPLYEGNAAADNGGSGGDNDPTHVVGRSRDSSGDPDAGLPASSNNRSDSSVSRDGGGLTPLVGTAQACGMVADALCGRATECAPFAIVQTFGSAEVCKKRMQTACIADANASHSGATNGGLIRCAQALNESTCGELTDGNRPPACRFVGTRPNGQPCGTHMQCQSGFCSGDGDPANADKACGKCAAPSGKDSSCAVDEDCTVGLRCSLDGKCVKPAPAGGACKPGYQPCDANLVCIDRQCRTPVAGGVSCAHPEQCGLSLGLVCEPEKVGSETLVCRATQPAAPGNSCGLDAMVTMPCAGGMTQCQPVGPGESLICVAPIRDGDACAPAEGKHCAAPSRCIAGFCRLGAPSGC
ncbi:MAG: hypothetical protein SGI86_00505 [Deltaproteobacteria bacterium]|nr:hypothetical protein [Deltaproteobacteria bacterium]